MARICAITTDEEIDMEKELTTREQISRWQNKTIGMDRGYWRLLGLWAREAETGWAGILREMTRKRATHEELEGLSNRDIDGPPFDMTESEKLTRDQVIRALDRLEKGWPEGLQICAMNGTLHLMELDSEGHLHKTDRECIDSDYVVDSWPRIKADGGGW